MLRFLFVILHEQHLLKSVSECSRASTGMVVAAHGISMNMVVLVQLALCEVHVFDAVDRV